MQEMKPKILCAEDDKTVREFLKTCLEMWGFEVSTASDTSEALSVLQNEELDLILTDEIMPGEGGLAVARLSRELSPRRPVVVCSGTAKADSPIGNLADAIVQKPFRPRELYATLQKALLESSQPTIATLWGVHQECMDFLGNIEGQHSATLFREEFKPRLEAVFAAIAEERNIEVEKVFSQLPSSELGQGSSATLAKLKYWVSLSRGRPA